MAGESRVGPGSLGGIGSVHIGELHLQVPAPNARAGRRIAERIGEGLAARLPPGFSGSIEGLKVEVKQPEDPSERALEEAITGAVWRALGRRRGATNE